MSRTAHRIYLATLALLVTAALITLIYRGYSYYITNLEERFFHPDHSMLKPSGIFGHGIGIIGSLLMILGVILYMARKRYRFLSRVGILKHWLEFHIFLCTLGPILVLFHTSFKFGGIVAISFWSMVAVFLSGIAGRFIYIQIPRSIEGRELSLQEIREMKGDIGKAISQSVELDPDSMEMIRTSIHSTTNRLQGNILSRTVRHYVQDLQSLRKIKTVLKTNNLPKSVRDKVIRLVRNEISLNRRIERLVTMQNLFKYWHVAHLPFALVMLVIMVIHVGVTIVFGYRWIF